MRYYGGFIEWSFVPLYLILTPLPPVNDRVTSLWQCAGELHSCNALIRQLCPQMSVSSVYTHVMSGPDAVSMSAPGSYHAVIAIPQLQGLRLCNCTGEFCPTMTVLCIFVPCNIYPVSSLCVHTWEMCPHDTCTEDYVRMVSALGGGENVPGMVEHGC